jgi:hypothetical protein
MQTQEAFWVEGDARRKYVSSLRPFASPPRRRAHQKGMTGARSGKALHLGVAAPELRKGVAGGRRRAGDEAAGACPREGVPCLVGSGGGARSSVAGRGEDEDGGGTAATVRRSRSTPLAATARQLW